MALTALLTILYAGRLYAFPLRIWVMQNEPVTYKETLTKEQIQAVVDRLSADEGIIIENGMRNLLLPAETKNPLAGYIVGHNQVLEELARFKRTQKIDEPIAIEFIRWEDAFNRILNGLTSGDTSNAPDVIQIGSTWVASFADMGVLTDLSGRFEEENFFPASVESTKVFGKKGTFAVPWFVDARVLYYHKDMIGSEEQFFDWKSFRETCDAFAKSGRPLLMGIPISLTWNLLHNLSPWLWAFGGDILTPSKFGAIHTHKVVIDSPQSTEALLYLKDLAKAGCMDFPLTTQEITDEKFIRGEYAAVITGPWMMKRLSANWREYGVALPPQGPQGSFPFVGGSHLAIPKVSLARGNFEKAIQLINHFVSPSSQKAYVDATGFLPANREALQSFFDEESTDVFKRALENGRSYPSIPEWGSVVENEIVRSHIWHIWRDIEQVVSDETLINMADNTASTLRSKLILTLARRHAATGAFAFGVASLLGCGSVIWLRRRMRNARKQIEQKSLELKRIEAERALLEGKALIMEKRRDEQSESLAKLKEELAKLNEKANRLSTELASANKKEQDGIKDLIGRFSIDSVGILIIDGEEVRFENNRQARRLIEHVVRQACFGTFEVHCLWGYPLFGWEAEKLRSHPKRLFDAMVSKINSRLKALGCPPLIEKSGRKTCSFRLCWNIDSITASSDIRKAMNEEEEASRSIAEGALESACDHAVRSLALDPKNLDAFERLKKLLRSSEDGRSVHQKGRMESILKISEHIIRQNLESLRKGIEEIEGMINKGALPNGIDGQTAGDELRAMKLQEEFMSTRLDSLRSSRVPGERPLFIDEIHDRMLAIQNEICSIKSSGASDEQMWASVIGSRSFERLLSIPRIKSMVNNFYNHDIQSREDPRLVQLAFISMLSSAQSLKSMSKAKDEWELICKINHELKRELLSLEEHLDSISPEC